MRKSDKVSLISIICCVAAAAIMFAVGLVVALPHKGEISDMSEIYAKTNAAMRGGGDLIIVKLNDERAVKSGRDEVNEILDLLDGAVWRYADKSETTGYSVILPMPDNKTCRLELCADGKVKIGNKFYESDLGKELFAVAVSSFDGK